MNLRKLFGRKPAHKFHGELDEVVSQMMTMPGSRRRRHARMHGDETSPESIAEATSLDGDSEYAPTYGAGATGSPPDDTLSPTNGGLDPFALALGTDDPVVVEDVELAPFMNDPFVVDHYEPPVRTPTLRNPRLDFGLESSFYSGFGPAAVVGCDMGCAAPGGGKLKG